MSFHPSEFAVALGRYEDCVRAWDSTGVDEPNIHVNMRAAEYRRPAMKQ